MADMLEEYNQKRHFEKTAEPRGETMHTGKQLRFVVQRHAARRDHYDLRLEWEGVMLSWAVPKGPSYDPRDKRLAVETEAHPLEYKDFEGTIPKGEYGGGAVMIWDEGYWEPQTDAQKGLKDGNLKIILHGKRLKGKWALVRMKPKDDETANNWLMIKEKDAYVLDNNGISAFKESLRTGRTLEEIADGQAAVKNPFESVTVQLAKLLEKAPEGEEWLFEIKFDGYRIVAYIEGGMARLKTRNNQDYTKNFSGIAEALAAWSGGKAMVLDGEVVALDAEGRSDFQALQNHLKNKAAQNLTYMVFDLLALDGEDMRMIRLAERKERLKALLKDAPQNIRFSGHIQGSGGAFLAEACKARLEGIIGKKADSVYSGARNDSWIKIKCANAQEFVIGGYTLTQNKHSGLSSVLLGVYEDDALVYAGRAGTGFTMKTMHDLVQRFKTLARDTPPFINAPKPKKDEKTVWLEPLTVAQIRFAEWTKDNLLRQASFKGLRYDKNPKDVKREY